LIMHTIQVLEGDNSGCSEPDSIASAGSECLRQCASALGEVIRGLSSFDCEDARANLVEPMLAYTLRHLETELQSGMGAGHSICAVIEIERNG
jgi:hypothetical protein